MAQAGSDTVIGPQVEMIILDCFETLVALGAGGYQPRKGVPVFLEHFGRRLGLHLVVHSDAEGPLVAEALGQAGLSDRFTAVYHAPEAVERAVDGTLTKCLDQPLHDARLEPFQVIFIGDSPLDARAAERYQVPFVRVPRSEDQDFTFARLIRGPSRYSSGEFANTMVEFYLKKKRK